MRGTVSAASAGMRAHLCSILTILALVGAPAAAYAQPDTCADDDAVCAVAQTLPQVEVAGVQTAADDARDLGEQDPFIINDGFGD